MAHVNRWAAAFTITAACATVGLALAEEPEFDPRVVVRREFPAILTPPTMSAREADEILKDNELVLGVTVNGKSRAYPINMLTGPRREIINDELGGAAIAATW